MSEAPFVTLLTPLTALPIILGLVMGIEECFIVIANHYGVNLPRIVPGSSTALNIGASLLLFGVAVLVEGGKLQLCVFGQDSN